MMDNLQAISYAEDRLADLREQKNRCLCMISAEHEKLARIELDINAYEKLQENIPDLVIEKPAGGGVVG